MNVTTWILILALGGNSFYGSGGTVVSTYPTEDACIQAGKAGSKTVHKGERGYYNTEIKPVGEYTFICVPAP